MNNTTFNASESLFKAINSVASSNQTDIFVEVNIGNLQASICKKVESAGTLDEANISITAYEVRMPELGTFVVTNENYQSVPSLRYRSYLDKTYSDTDAREAVLKLLS